MSFGGVRVADSWEALPLHLREPQVRSSGVRIGDVTTTHDCKDGEVEERVWKRLGKPPRDSELFDLLRSDYRHWVRCGRRGDDPVTRYLELKAAEQAAAKPALGTGTRDGISNIITLAAVNRAHLTKFDAAKVHDHDLAHRPIRTIADVNARNRACWRHA
jgi:hypothetical protein